MKKVMLLAFILTGCASVPKLPTPAAALTPQQVQACEAIPSLPRQADGSVQMGDLSISYKVLRGLYKQCSALNDEKVGILQRAAEPTKQ